MVSGLKDLDRGLNKERYKQSCDTIHVTSRIIRSYCFWAICTNLSSHKLRLRESQCQTHKDEWIIYILFHTLPRYFWVQTHKHRKKCYSLDDLLLGRPTGNPGSQAVATLKWWFLHRLHCHLAETDGEESEVCEKETDLYTYPPGKHIPKNGILKMIFLFPRWDMLIAWRVYHHISHDMWIEDDGSVCVCVTRKKEPELKLELGWHPYGCFRK